MAKPEVTLVSEDKALSNGLCCDECAACLCCVGTGQNDKGRPVGKWLLINPDDRPGTYCPNCIDKALKDMRKEIKGLQAVADKVEALIKKDAAKKTAKKR